MSKPELGKAFITSLPLPKTSAAHEHIRYAQGVSSAPESLFSRIGWFPANGDAGADAPGNIYVLFVGTAEAIEKHQPAIDDVTALGNDVMVFEFAGQGDSGRFLADGRKVHAMPDGFDMWVDSLKEFMRSDLFRAVRQRGYDHGVEVIALPYSLGGHMFARMLIEAPVFAKRFTRIVYVNPVVAMHSASNMFVRTVQLLYASRSVMQPETAEAFVPGHGKYHPGDRPLAKSGIGSDEARHAWICDFYHRNPHLAMWGMTYGWFNEANRSLTKLWEAIVKGESRYALLRFLGVAHRVQLRRRNATQVPTLVISSQKDTIVIAHYVQRFARYIGADCLQLPRAKHEPTQEPPQIRDGTIAAVAAWVENPDAPEMPVSEDIRFVRRRGD